MSQILRILTVIGIMGAISLILGSIASFAIPDSFFLAIKQVFSYFKLLGFIIPTTTIATVISLTLVFQSAMVSWWGIKWIIHFFKPF